VLALSAAPGAFADAALKATTPTDGSVSSDPVTQVDLTFSGPVELDVEATRLLDGEGSDLNFVAAAGEDGREWSLVPDAELQGSPYGVIWEAKSADGHTVKGTVRFEVEAVATQQEPEPSEPSESEEAPVVDEAEEAQESEVAQPATPTPVEETASTTTVDSEATSAQSQSTEGGGLPLGLIAVIVALIVGVGAVLVWRQRSKTA
jgi:methionine-rich copper-binding protein CopC